jgi:hypothetical protein
MQELLSTSLNVPCFCANIRNLSSNPSFNAYQKSSKRGISASVRQKDTAASLRKPLAIIYFIYFYSYFRAIWNNGIAVAL